MENAPDDVPDLMWSSYPNKNDDTLSATSLANRLRVLPRLTQQQSYEKMVKHGEILKKLDEIVKQLSSDTRRLYHDVSDFKNKSGRVGKEKLCKNVAKMTDNIERLQADESSLSKTRSKLAKNAYVPSKKFNFKYEKQEKASKITSSGSKAVSSSSKSTGVPSSANLVSGKTDSTKNSLKLSLTKRISNSVFGKNKKESAKAEVLHYSGSNTNSVSESMDSLSSYKENQTPTSILIMHPSGSRLNLASDSTDAPLHGNESESSSDQKVMNPYENGVLESYSTALPLHGNESESSSDQKVINPYGNDVLESYSTALPLHGNERESSSDQKVMNPYGNDVLESESIALQLHGNETESSSDQKPITHLNENFINLTSDSIGLPSNNNENERSDPKVVSGVYNNIVSYLTGSPSNERENETSDPKSDIHFNGNHLNLDSDLAGFLLNDKENETPNPNVASESWINLALPSLPDLSHLTSAIKSLFVGEENEPKAAELRDYMDSGRDLESCTPAKSFASPFRSSPQKKLKKKQKKVCGNPSFLSMLTHHPTILNPARSHCNDCNREEFNADEFRVNVSFTDVDYRHPKNANEHDRWAMSFSMVDRFDNLLHTTIDEMFENVDKKLQQRLDMKAFGGKLLDYLPKNKERKFINNQISSINKEDVLMPLKGLMSVDKAGSKDHDKIKELLEDDNNEIPIPKWLGGTDIYRKDKLFHSNNKNKLLNNLLKSCSRLSFSDESEESSSDDTSSNSSDPSSDDFS